MQTDFNQPGGGGGAGKSAASAASATSGNNFAGLVSPDGGLTPLAGVILAALGLLSFIALVVVAKR